MSCALSGFLRTDTVGARAPKIKSTIGRRIDARYHRPSDDFDREWAYRRGYAHGAEAVVAALRPHLPEAIRRKAEVWLACELISWRAQFQTKNDAAARIPFEVSMPISDWVVAVSGDAS